MLPPDEMQVSLSLSSIYLIVVFAKIRLLAEIDTRSVKLIVKALHPPHQNRRSWAFLFFDRSQSSRLETINMEDRQLCIVVNRPDEDVLMEVLHVCLVWYLSVSLVWSCGDVIGFACRL